MRSGVCFSLVLLVAGCGTSQRARELRGQIASEIAVATEQSEEALAPTGGNGRGDAQGNGQGTGQGRGQRRGECPVMIDGRLVGALKYSELPPQMPTWMFPLDDGRKVQRFRISEYVRALGVSLDRVRALHLHGGRRVTVIDGNELRRVGDRLQIQFTSEVSGRPTFTYPGVDLRSNSAIDSISTFALYADSPAPEYRRGRLYAGDKQVDGGADDAKLAIRGTRVYLDGKLVRALKRRDAGSAKQELAAVLRKLGVDAAKLKLAEIVARDGVAARVAGANIAALETEAPRGSHGRLVIDGVAEGEPVEAILLYANSNPSHRHAGHGTAGHPHPGSAVFSPTKHALGRPSSIRRGPEYPRRSYIGLDTGNTTTTRFAELDLSEE
jgi:hypothetical protein